MSVESLIFDTLKGLVSNHVYPDIAPAGVTALPRVTYQQVGGDAVNYVESVPADKKNARFQINCWGATRLQVAALSRQVEDAIKSTGALYPTILGAPVGSYETDTKLYGTRQDFAFWF